MATPAQRTNTWTLDQWYDQAVAGTTGGYQEAFELFAWGGNDDGQLGQNNPTKYSSPVQIPGTTWDKIFSTHGDYSTFYAIKNNGTLWSWGSNDYDLLGDATTQGNRSSPLQVGTATNWKALFGGKRATLASKTDGTLWIWGDNEEGILGQNDDPNIQTPVQIPGTNWTGTLAAMGMGDDSAGALKTDGTLWTWGTNGHGQLMLNDRTERSSPTQVPGTWQDFKINRRLATATKTNGTLWACGTNYKGGLGQNTDGGYRSSPVQIPGTTWRSVGGNGEGYTGWALKTDNTMWAWGPNFYGALGQNEGPGSGGTKDGASSPVQIPGTNWDNYSVARVAGTGDPAMLAAKTDGSLWVWGPNIGDFKGGLGLNDIISRSSPTQLPGDWEGSRGRYTATGSSMAALKKT